MFKKTSSVDYMKYGEVFTDVAAKNETYEGNQILTIQGRNINNFYKCDTDVYIKCVTGIIMLVVTNDINSEEYAEFVVHRVVKINRGVYFNFVTLGDDALLEMAIPNYACITSNFGKLKYHYNRIKPIVRVNEIASYFYSVRGVGYHFPGERCECWELTYVDSGTLYTTIDGKEFEINNNQLILYAPGQFHTQSTKDKICSYLTVMFDMNLPVDLQYNIINTQFTAGRETKKSLESLVYSTDIKKNPNPTAMVLALERIINNAIRSKDANNHKKEQKIASTPMQQKFENELLQQIILYINENIYSSFNVQELCDHFAISRSSLQSLFRNNMGIAPKEYLSTLKLEKSKLLIKESKYSISEISDILGFSSIHYFSRKFKQEFGITPTDYANKIM